MNVFTHDEYIKEQLRRVRRMQWLGLGAVFVSMVLAFVPSEHYLTIFLAYPFLLVGLPLWMAARSAQRRLARSPSVDQALTDELKGLSVKYSLHHHPVVDGVVIPHLLIGPQGLVVMVTSDAAGPVTCTGGPKGDRWRSRSSLLDRLSGLNPPVGNPTRELDSAISAARKLLEDHGKPGVAVRGLIIFTRNPEVYLEECSYAAVPLNEVRQAVKELLADMGSGSERERDEGVSLDVLLTSQDRRRLNLLLKPPVSMPAPRAASARR
jgi:hypothetical protein